MNERTLLDLPDGAGVPPAALCAVCGTNPGTIESTGGMICKSCLADACMTRKERDELAKAGRKATRDASRANRGIPTEQRARESAERMASQGIAWLSKVPTPWRVCGRKGAFVQCVPAEKAIVDFVGYDYEGRFVCVEVKSDSSPTARFYLRAVPGQQRAYLDNATAMGGRAYLLVDFPNCGAWYLIPWHVAREWVRVAPEDAPTSVYRADPDAFLTWDLTPTSEVRG